MQQENKRRLKLPHRLIIVGTVAICVIAVLFSALNISAVNRMTRATAAIYEHPYTVSNSAREMRSRLLDMKQFISIFLTDGFVSEDETQVLLHKRYDLQRESIDVIAKNFIGPHAYVEQLKEHMDALIAAQDEALHFVISGHTDPEIDNYVEANLYPCYDDVSVSLSTIIDASNDTILRLERDTKATGEISIAVAVVLSSFIIGFTVLTTLLLEQKRQREVAYREKLFDLLSANVDDVFFIYSLESKSIEYISPNSVRILGLTEENLQERHALFPMLSEEDGQKLEALFGGGIIRVQAERDFRFQKREGQEPRWMNLKVYPVMGGSRVSRYIICISDQTERILVQQNLRDALVVAQNANDAKRDFLARMSHEIRTPMNAIIGMTTIAAAHITEQDRVEDCLHKISFSSRHLLSLINDVLDMSKIEDGKLTISYEPFAFSQLIESVTSIVYAQTRERGQLFDASLIGFTEEALIGDSLRVNQILLNLLSNAVKFTPAGGSIRLEIRQLAVKNKQVHNQVRLRFTVSDTGIGMSEEFLQHLYTPFEQADGSIARRFGGTGLGMSITKNLVTLLGGTIKVHSKQGKGTTFEVELPFDLQAGHGALPHMQKLESLRVLVVDDDKDTCVHASLLLKKLGIAAKWVLSGAKAVESVLKAHETGEDYDVCFIDWQMSEMDGVETTRRIREFVGPETLIIIISAYDWGPIEEAARAAGANAFISKPMFASAIYNTLLSVTGAAAAAAREIPSPAVHDLSGKRILLAEDNALNMEIAMEILSMAKARVECAENGEEAVKKVLASPAGYYDLVLMDIQMPVMNGHEATRKIRASVHPDAASLIILAMTANAFNEDVAAALEAGMNGHIAKPIDVNHLYDTLDSFFGR